MYVSTKSFLSNHACMYVCFKNMGLKINRVFVLKIIFAFHETFSYQMTFINEILVYFFGKFNKRYIENAIIIITLIRWKKKSKFPAQKRYTREIRRFRSVGGPRKLLIKHVRARESVFVVSM